MGFGWQSNGMYFTCGTCYSEKKIQVGKYGYCPKCSRDLIKLDHKNPKACNAKGCPNCKLLWLLSEKTPCTDRATSFSYTGHYVKGG